ncbi:hypothetical protein L6164_035756 [Bauhinia variegata]|uniref:Uncharacterized protein n=1 Tax=Bauhinia variegata TaxID=167791 RepID=A0ACB9KF17_BAUVA|nr:hypothetical protein L6164_035756 [Bauhinia variegata]
MDLGCFDLGCISATENRSTEVISGSQIKEDGSNESLTGNSKIGKNKLFKEAGQSTSNALNKFSSQIKKPPHRKTSPINWFPRKKVDSYLKRKIKMLQEVDGMNLTLDQTLGNANPHYSRVLREKMAAREAANKAMEARRAALVEASWCRILRAARIPSEDAEAKLVKAEKSAVEAFEAAQAMGVIMYDMPNCPGKDYRLETSSVNGEGSSTLAVTASFETAFEVDKEVAAAVKTAFVRLANCPSFNKDEFRELLRKISENPDIGESNKELSEFTLECDSESGSELDSVSRQNDISSQDVDSKVPVLGMCHRKSRRRQSLDKLNRLKLVDMMIERLKCLHEVELSSLATIVATCGLNAALSEVQNIKPHDQGSGIDHISTSSVNISSRRMSSLGSRNSELLPDVHIRKKQVGSELPSLDKFLVTHVTKLEREVQEAKNNRRNETESERENSDKVVDGNGMSNRQKDATLPSLDKFLVKRVSRLEKEVQEAKNRRIIENKKSKKVDLSTFGSDGALEGKENRDSNKIGKSSEIEQNECKVNSGLSSSEDVNDEIEENKNGLDKILKKPVHRLEREKLQALSLGSHGEDYRQRKSHGVNNVPDCESLDMILVKHVSRLEKEKMRLNAEGERPEVKRIQRNSHLETSEEGGLDQILVKHKSRLEREKMVAAQQLDNPINHSVSRREARERELQEAWGGLSLGNSMKPRLSKLEREKAAWTKAEEEERRQAMSAI